MSNFYESKNEKNEKGINFSIAEKIWYFFCQRSNFFLNLKKILKKKIFFEKKKELMASVLPMIVGEYWPDCWEMAPVPVVNGHGVLLRPFFVVLAQSCGATPLGLVLHRAQDKPDKIASADFLYKLQRKKQTKKSVKKMCF